VRRRILFVGGVAGSGKTTACRQILALIQGHILNVGSIACPLAVRHGLTAADIEHMPISHLEALQDLVAEEISRRARALPTGDLLVIDGHFVLPGIGREAYRLPPRFFAMLEISGILVCTPSIEEIRFRVASDSARTRPLMDFVTMANHAHAEAAHAMAIANKCGIPFASITCAADILGRLLEVAP
jgi:adenylate kinase